LTRLLDLQIFYPKDIEITKKSENVNKIHVSLKSRTKSQICPKCGIESSHHHSTYMRNIKDLPILGKAVELEVTAYKYDCENLNCDQKVFCEELNGFSGKYRRMTSRCEDLIVSIAMNTSCEAASEICKHMGVKISGDTVIRILMRDAKAEPTCSEIIGVDDWSFKKRQNYGTIVCDLETGKPVTLLNGRDGAELKKWLEQNKHVKVVSRDRASSYARAISEVLPDAIQVADRFHLHQNLFLAVKDAMKRVLPEKIEVTNSVDTTIKESPEQEPYKKNKPSQK
jgi:transposase